LDITEFRIFECFAGWMGSAYFFGFLYIEWWFDGIIIKGLK